MIYGEDLLLIRGNINKRIKCKNKDDKEWVCDNCFNKYIDKIGIDKNNKNWYLPIIKYVRGDITLDQIDKNELSNLNDNKFRDILIGGYNLLYMYVEDFEKNIKKNKP
jgi:hypothetical protein